MYSPIRWNLECEEVYHFYHLCASGVAYPDSLEPVDLVVEQHLCVGEVDVTVVCVVE